ncbi:MAG: MotA/TolQ/ExbB proton channel family protein [Candidatus Dependentiae bacterium]|nr:MotA/TolQ/ExbB proton channel family protein [Candidatus Dependentiae bacterium]
MLQKIAIRSMWDVVATSTFLSKFILLASSLVLLVDLFIFFYKLMLFREQLNQIRKVRQSLATATTLQDLLAVGSVLKGSLPGLILGRGLKTLKIVLQGGAPAEHRRISDQEMVAVQDALDQALSDALYQESAYLSVLSVGAAVAPLVGLFGTITGLIQAFVAIGQQRTADISVVAPGIAEALLTTFGGLTVAITAYLMFHYLTSRLRAIEHELEGLIFQCEVLIKNALGE